MKDDLDNKLDAALNSLPELAAPPALINRTMRRIDSLPWYRRPWMAWPTGWRYGSVFLSLGLLVAGCWAQPTVTGLVRGALARGSAETAWIGDAVGVLVQAMAAVLGHFAGVLVLVGLVSYLACIGFGSAIYQLASFRSKQRYL